MTNDSGCSYLRARGTSLVELVITASSPLNGQTLRDADLLRKYRAVPLAVRHREDVVHAMAMIEEVRRFYARAAEAGEAVLFWVE